MAMLKPFRNVPLRIPPDGDLSGYFAGLEACKYAEDEKGSDQNSELLRLDGAEIEDWAYARGPFSKAKDANRNGRLQSRLKILFAQAKSTIRNPIPDRLANGSVLQALNLPLDAFAAFGVASGVFFVRTSPQGAAIEDCSSIGFVLYTPQKWECSIGGLAVSHNFTTGTTTALILGYDFALDEFKGEPPARLRDFLQQVMECRDNWCHPLFLPSAFLTHHALKVQGYIRGPLSKQVMRIENNIGVTKAGRTNTMRYAPPDADEVLYIDGQLQRENAKRLTGSINDLSTWVIFAKRSPQWDIDCANFLLDLLARTPRLQQCKDVGAHAFTEVLGAIRMYSEASLEVTQTSAARMQLQLNILYTAIAQDDNQTSARLAASAGKDSTSMKILALITAAYLPGTFIASLFSMSMFDWSSGSTGSVASSFWIYWAVAIPLTIVTLAGWGFWWQIEKGRFETNVQQNKEARGLRKYLGDML